MAGTHPDLRVLEPLERNEDGDAKRLEAIPVVQVRGLTDFVQLTSHRGGRKVGLIVPAERLNSAAENALLKTLEEPPPDTYLVLVSHQPGRLRATTLSRCRRIPVPFPPTDAATRWLAAHGVSDAAAALGHAAGAPYAALAQLALHDERATWITALGKPASLSALGLAARIDAAGRDERKDRLAAALDWMLGWSVDLARVAAGAAPRFNPDARVRLDALAGQVAGVALSRYHRSLLRQRDRLAHPLVPRLVAEALLIEYRSLFDHGG
jgi:DNA polymerase-3 subunit delta'